MLKISKPNNNYDSIRLIELKLISQYLPSTYIRFLEQYNGGYVHKDSKSLYVEAINDNFDIEYLFSLEQVLKLYKDPGKEIPDILMAIGNNAFGELLCLTIKGEKSGNIYMYNPFDGEGEAIEGEIESYNNAYYICGSFEEMCTSLEKAGNKVPDQ